MQDIEACPIAKTSKVISGKWTLLIFRDLATGPRRFNQLEKSLDGISPKTLSNRLRSLEYGQVDPRGLLRGDPRVGTRTPTRARAVPYD